MSDVQALRSAFRDAPQSKKRSSKSEARANRAARTRAKALSPLRILFQVICVPMVTLAVTISIYTRTSPYEQADALRHLVALAGCGAAESVGLAPTFEGEMGYHKRNDPDGNGIACEFARGAKTRIATGPLDVPDGPGAGTPPAPDTPTTTATNITGAKFLRP